LYFVKIIDIRVRSSVQTGALQRTEVKLVHGSKIRRKLLGQEFP